MRYSTSESTYILGKFNSGDTVNIYIYRLSDDSLIVDGDACTEIANTGIFKYLFSVTVNDKEEYLYIMTNGEYSHIGKIVVGGVIELIRRHPL